MSAPRYPILLRPIAPEDGGGWLATIPDLPGCLSDGATVEQAVANLEDAKAAWLEAEREKGAKIPESGASDPVNAHGAVLLDAWTQGALRDHARERGLSPSEVALSLIAEALAARAKRKAAGLPQAAE